MGDPGPVGVETVELAAAPEQQSLADDALEVAMLALDGAVLVRHAGVVAGRRHPVVGAQRLVAACLVGAGVVVEVAERGRQAVGPVLDRHAAERPECVLQADRKRREALAANDRLGVFPGGVGQGEVIQPMGQRCAGDADAEVAHVGEVGQPLLSRSVVLTEDHLAVGAVLGPPSAHPAFQATTEPIPIMVRVPAQHLVEHPDGPQTRRGFEHRADLAVPQSAEGIRILAAQGAVGDRRCREMAVRLNAAGGALADAGLGGGETLGVALAELHEQSHLLAGDASSGHSVLVLAIEEPSVPAHAAASRRGG